MSTKKIILIAGGTGLIGKALVKRLSELGHEVRVLSRKADQEQNIYGWSPAEKRIDIAAFEGVEVLINLVGEGIADKRWTTKRKQALIDSRVDTTRFLASQLDNIPHLKHYITASGINCYGYNHYERKHTETDPFGDDFLSQVVKKWETAADKFAVRVKVAKIRTSVVLAKEGGAVPAIAKTINNYIGAPLGSGKQWMPWISMEDMIGVYVHTVEKELDGAYNALAGSVTNKAFTKALAKQLNKPLWLPNVPSFVMKMLLGEMASVVLEGLQADNSKLIASGFTFKHTELEEALFKIYEE
jgi:uncharacterized protein (TIGR01777 family)